MKQTATDASELTPLLEDVNSLENQSPRGRASVSCAVFNVCTTMVGAGIMSIPATFKVLGIIPAFAVMFTVAILVEVTVKFLLRYTQSGKSTTYAGLMAESFGSLGSLALQICVVVTNLGCLIIYLIIIGKPGIFFSWPLVFPGFAQILIASSVSISRCLVVWLFESIKWLAKQ